MTNVNDNMAYYIRHIVIASCHSQLLSSGFMDRCPLVVHFRIWAEVLGNLGTL